MLGKVNNPLLDVEDALLSFGRTSKTARKTYLKRMNAALAAEERREISERLPWWKPDRELKPSEDRAYVDLLGRSTGLERRHLEVEDFVALACAGLGISINSLSGPHKDRAITRLRQLVATVGIERWGQRAGRIGGVLGKHPDVVSRWARAGAVRRSTDCEFAEAIAALDAILATSPNT